MSQTTTPPPQRRHAYWDGPTNRAIRQLVHAGDRLHHRHLARRHSQRHRVPAGSPSTQTTTLESGASITTTTGLGALYWLFWAIGIVYFVWNKAYLEGTTTQSLGREFSGCTPWGRCRANARLRHRVRSLAAAVAGFRDLLHRCAVADLGQGPPVSVVRQTHQSRGLD